MSSHHVNDLTEWNTILVPLKNNVVIHLLDVQVVVAGLDIHGSTGGKGAALGGGDRGGGRGGVVLLNIGCQGSNLAAVQPVAGKLQRRRGKREGSAIESSQEHEATTEGECTPTHTHTHTQAQLSHIHAHTTAVAVPTATAVAALSPVLAWDAITLPDMQRVWRAKAFAPALGAASLCTTRRAAVRPTPNMVCTAHQHKQHKQRTLNGKCSALLCVVVSWSGGSCTWFD